MAPYQADHLNQACWSRETSNRCWAGGPQGNAWGMNICTASPGAQTHNHRLQGSVLIPLSYQQSSCMYRLADFKLVKHKIKFSGEEEKEDEEED